MKLVIPYRHDQNREGYELRYAIRSMVKYFKPLSGVVLIGDKPDWFKGEYIEAKDGMRKEWNIVSKILSCPYEDFLYSNDDYFATEGFDETLPNYYSGPLSSAQVFGKYTIRRNNVMKVYPDGMFYDIHVPMIINLEKYKEANNVEWNKYEYLCKSLYGNFVGGGQQMVDCKIRAGAKLPEGWFFSTNDRTARLVTLPELFPDASQYE